jgi:hypothetical protein
MKRKSLYDQSDCLEWEFKVFETHHTLMLE